MRTALFINTTLPQIPHANSRHSHFDVQRRGGMGELLRCFVGALPLVADWRAPLLTAVAELAARRLEVCRCYVARRPAACRLSAPYAVTNLASLEILTLSHSPSIFHQNTTHIKSTVSLVTVHYTLIYIQQNCSFLSLTIISHQLVD